MQCLHCKSIDSLAVRDKTIQLINDSFKNDFTFAFNCSDCPTSLKHSSNMKKFSSYARRNPKKHIYEPFRKKAVKKGIFHKHFFLDLIQHNEVFEFSPSYLCLNKQCLTLHCWNPDGAENHLLAHFQNNAQHSVFLEVHSGCIFCTECEVFYSDLGHNLKSEKHKNRLFETRVLLAQYNYLYEFFMSLQDPRKNYLMRNYELFESKQHSKVKNWLVKSKLISISSYLSKKYLKEALHHKLKLPNFNTCLLRPLFQSPNLLLSVLILENVTYLRKYIGHLMINDEYTNKYFSVSFLDDFLKHLGKVFKLVRKNPGAVLAQEEIHDQLKFRKKDRKRKKAILESISHIPQNDLWGQGFFKMVSNQFGVSPELLDLYQLLIASNSGLSCHRNLPLKQTLLEFLKLLKHSTKTFDVNFRKTSSERIGNLLKDPASLDSHSTNLADSLFESNLCIEFICEDCGKKTKHSHRFSMLELPFILEADRDFFYNIHKKISKKNKQFQTKTFKSKQIASLSLQQTLYWIFLKIGHNQLTINTKDLPLLSIRQTKIQSQETQSHFFQNMNFFRKEQVKSETNTCRFCESHKVSFNFYFKKLPEYLFLGFDAKNNRETQEKEPPVEFAQFSSQSEDEPEPEQRHVKVEYTPGGAANTADPVGISEFQEATDQSESATAPIVIQVKLTRKRKRNSDYKLKLVVYREKSSFVGGKEQTCLLIRLKSDKSNPLNNIQTTSFESQEYFQELHRLDKMKRKGKRVCNGLVLSAVGLVFVDFEAHLKKVSASVTLVLYKRVIESNKDIRRKIKKMLVNTKTARSSRICIPISIIYNTVYLDKWDRLVSIGDKCQHGLLLPSFWDVFRQSPGEGKQEIKQFSANRAQEKDKQWIRIRQSFSQNFEFELVNSCLLDINKKKNLLDQSWKRPKKGQSTKEADLGLLEFMSGCFSLDERFVDFLFMQKKRYLEENAEFYNKCFALMETKVRELDEQILKEKKQTGGRAWSQSKSRTSSRKNAYQMAESVETSVKSLKNSKAWDDNLSAISSLPNSANLSFNTSSLDATLTQYAPKKSVFASKPRPSFPTRSQLGNSLFSKSGVHEKGLGRKQSSHSVKISTLFSSRLNTSVFNRRMIFPGEHGIFGTKTENEFLDDKSKVRKMIRRQLYKKSYIKEIDVLMKEIKANKLKICEHCLKKARLGTVRKYMQKTLLCKYMNKKTPANYLVSKQWFSQWENYLFLSDDSNSQIRKHFFNKVDEPSEITNKLILTRCKQKIMEQNSTQSQNKRGDSKLVFNATVYNFAESSSVFNRVSKPQKTSTFYVKTNSARRRPTQMRSSVNLQIPTFNMIHSQFFPPPKEEREKEKEEEEEEEEKEDPQFVQVNEYVFQILALIYGFDTMIVKKGKKVDMFKQSQVLLKAPKKVVMDPDYNSCNNFSTYFSEDFQDNGSKDFTHISRSKQRPEQRTRKRSSSVKSFLDSGSSLFGGTQLQPSYLMSIQPSNKSVKWPSPEEAGKYKFKTYLQNTDLEVIHRIGLLTEDSFEFIAEEYEKVLECNREVSLLIRYSNRSRSLTVRHLRDREKNDIVQGVTQLMNSGMFLDKHKVKFDFSHPHKQLRSLLKQNYYILGWTAFKQETENKRLARSPPPRSSRFCNLLRTIESKRETPSCYQPSAFKAQKHQLSNNPRTSSLRGITLPKRPMQFPDFKQREGESRKCTSSEKIDVQHLFSKISMQSRSLESLLVPEEENSRRSSVQIKRSKRSRFADLARDSIELEDKENQVLDAVDKGFTKRAKMIYNRFGSSSKPAPYRETDLRRTPLTNRNRNSGMVVKSAIQRKELQGKIAEFQSSPMPDLPTSFISKQRQLLLDWEKNESGQDGLGLNFDLMIHGYLKGVYQRFIVEDRKQEDIPTLADLYHEYEDRRISKLSESELNWIDDMANGSRVEWESDLEADFDLSDY